MQYPPKLSFLLTIFFVTLSIASDLCVASEPTASGEHEFFEKEIRPLLIEHCYECHSVKAKKLKAGLLLDSRDDLVRGGDSGPAIVPGDVAASLLIESVRYESYEMPPKGKLPDKEIEKLERWVSLGAPWPQEEPPKESLGQPKFDLASRRTQHWVWQPILKSELPSVQNEAWPRDSLDRFVLKRIEDAGLTPAIDADPAALIRRLYFDLIGLPPTPAQLAKSLSEKGPDSIAHLVDELLQSPHFGERWGRYWLDLVRYAESRGHEFDNDSPNAFQYRDYIIRAFNADVPYDQLVREHIAGDLLESPRLNPEAGFNESILGTGFWFLGEWVHSPVDIRKDETDRFDNMIDVMSKTFLGVTVACARCHDHKFDAISSADYYALSGFLQSSDYRQVPFESIEHNRQIADELTKLDEEYRQQVVREISALTSGIHPPTLEVDQAKVLVDFALVSPNEFIQDGFLFGTAPRVAGQPSVSMVDNQPKLTLGRRTAAVSDPFWHGLKSINEQGVANQDRLKTIPSSGRTLHTPMFTLREGTVSCRVSGSGFVVACVDSHRLIAGPLHGETIHTIDPNQPWTTLRLDRYIGHSFHLEFTPAENATLEVSWVLQGATPEILNQVDQYDAAIERSVVEQEKLLTDLPAASQEASARLRQAIQSWATARELLRQRVQTTSHLAMAMLDATGEDDHLLIRGSTANPGILVARKFLTAVSGEEPLSIHLGSGRLELANQINHAGNPLTSRVIVNRLWHYLLGRGIVPTTDDFGVLGQRPTHPELLDYLATEFMDDGRSIKRMIRRIVLSRTYQVSSFSSPRAVELDPKNLLWHHRPPKRLEGEAIRDALLAVSGRLDEKLYGEPVPIHLTSFMDGRGRPGNNGPLDGNGRRSIYVAVRRNFLSPWMLAFDSPVPFSTMGRRNVSNVPAQALTLMNDPLVIDQTRLFAERAWKMVPDDGTTGSLSKRIEWLYLAAFARPPTDFEQQSVGEFLAAQASARGVELNQVELWSDLAHALVNTKEFIFLR